ncbi:MAG: hypothetical protein GY719_16845 [bacterium]|nr:hypothetical protein [bacterium]
MTAGGLSRRLAGWLDDQPWFALPVLGGGITILVLAVIETLLGVLLAHPAWLGEAGFVPDGVRSIYLREDWSIPQGDPKLVTWDPELTYVLTTGPGRFVNREFDTTLAGNSAGLRDDEASLESPDLIVLGDSYTLGWGVERHETFAQVLERRTGLRVLNAGMSSYATARQMILLERLDTSAARAVVVQYFLNDFAENRAFVDGGFSLDITPRSELEDSIRSFQRQARYWPSDYLRAFLYRSHFFPELATVSPEEVAETALRVLASSDELEDLPVFFLQIDPWTRFSGYNIIGPMTELLRRSEHSELAGRLTLVPLDGVLTSRDFFLLDPHLRPGGHDKVAAELEQALVAAGLL